MNTSRPFKPTTWRRSSSIWIRCALSANPSYCPLSLPQVLDDLDPGSVAFRRVLQKLQGICSSRTLIPSSHSIPVDLLNIDNTPFGSGGFSDVFQGTYAGSVVCIKRPRMSAISSPERVTKGNTPHSNVNHPLFSNGFNSWCTGRPWCGNG